MAPPPRLFRDRAHAGIVLAERLRDMVAGTDAIVLVLPRGGVPVGHAVAQVLQLPFDLFLVRKLGLPGDEELALGAVANGGIQVLNEDLVRYLRVPSETIRQIAQTERAEIARQEQLYRQGRTPLSITERTVILVDDGIATGATMRAAIKALRQKAPERIIVAAPVAPSEVCGSLQSDADNVVCVANPQPFHAVGVWYESFPQTTDDEVRLLLLHQPTGASLNSI